MRARPRAIPISSIEGPKPGTAFGSVRARLVPSNYDTEYFRPAARSASAGREVLSEIRGQGRAAGTVRPPTEAASMAVAA
jgi:hypothetical protein